MHATNWLPGAARTFESPLRSAFLYRLKSFWDLQIDSLLRSDDAEYAVKYRTGSSTSSTTLSQAPIALRIHHSAYFSGPETGTPVEPKSRDWNGQVNLAFKILEKDEATPRYGAYQRRQRIFQLDFDED